MTYPQGPYPQQPYQYPPYQPPRRTNSTAVAALVCGAVGLFTGFVGIVAIVLGHIARRQIARTGEDGAGIALAGLILGYISLVILISPSSPTSGSRWCSSTPERDSPCHVSRPSRR